ncbi:hypothetical protein VNO77_20819 [Canavalia gladiata]|uniref:Uncharacterized protein n=1 Tax=Canavalia gladiata TaxID=3824 RepID=A0AAN9LPY5_CANGL
MSEVLWSLSSSNSSTSLVQKGKKMKPKWGFIFQINEHGFGTQLHEEKGQKKGPNHIDYLPPPYPHYLYRTSSNTPLIFHWLLLTHM